MSRFVKWITLTPEERRQVQPAHLAYQSGQESGQEGGSGASRLPLVKQHACSVTLPDGSCCRVGYTRQSPRAHRFDFDPPLRQTLYAMTALDNSVAGIEAKAQALAKAAFRMAQQEESKTMQRATPPPGYRKATLSSEASRISAKTAQGLAGRYAVCLRFVSGRLLCLGAAYEGPR